MNKEEPKSLFTLMAYECWVIETELSIATDKDYPFGLGKEWEKKK